MEDDCLITLEDVREYTGWEARKLKKLVRHGGFPMKKIGGQWVSSKALIDEWRRERIKEKPPIRGLERNTPVKEKI
jgi:hypothetical protein